VSTPPPPQLRRRLLPAALLLLVLLTVPPAVSLALSVAGVSGRLALIAARRARSRRTRAELTPDSGSIILGVSPDGRAVVLPDRALAAHGLILGASGSGKSTTMLTILCAQIDRGRPVVVIDMKGSPLFAAELRQMTEAAGRRFLQWTPDGGAHWNPLASGNATELKDKLIATERFTEPHYQRAAERFLQLTIQVQRELRPETPPTLTSVVEMLDPDRLAASVRSLAPDRGDRIRDYLSSLTPDQISAVRGLATRLAVLTESHTGPYLEPGDRSSTIDLRQTLAGPAAQAPVVVFSLNSSSYGRLAAQLGTLVVQDLVSATGARLSSAESSSPPPAVIAIDEFSGLQSDNVLALLARGREAGMGVLLATQELADLDRAARGLRDQVLGNTAVKIAHRQDVPESAETVARLAGTLREWERTYHERPGPLGGSDLRRSSLRLVDRYAVEPDRIRTLGTGEAVVIVKAPRSQTSFARVNRPARTERGADLGRR